MSLCDTRFQQKIRCSQCSLRQLCLPMMLADAEIEHLESIVQRGRAIVTGKHLFFGGDKFEGIFAVRSGCIKTYTVSAQGEERITGFYLPGEIMGLDAISSSRHSNFAKSLETSSVCMIPFDRLSIMAAEIPSLQKQIFKLLSEEIIKDQELMLLLGKMNAAQKMAAFLINLSVRYSRRGFSGTRFRLPMTRADIGNYLGLAIETVSRLVTRLQKEGVLLVKEREIEILNLDKLSQLAGVKCHLEKV